MTLIAATQQGVRSRWQQASRFRWWPQRGTRRARIPLGRPPLSRSLRTPIQPTRPSPGVSASVFLLLFGGTLSPLPVTSGQALAKPTKFGGSSQCPWSKPSDHLPPAHECKPVRLPAVELARAGSAGGLQTCLGVRLRPGPPRAVRCLPTGKLFGSLRRRSDQRQPLWPACYLGAGCYQS
jgi:hypothetical protein